jgi:hypothetical protein
MPSTSKAQQRLMGMAYAYKKGELDPKEASQEVKDLADSMTLQQLKDFASTKHEGLPEVAEGITPASINGMGGVSFPTEVNPGSGDVPAGQGDAEEEYKKKMKKMEKVMNFEAYVKEAYDGNFSDFKYEFPLIFNEVTGNSENAIKRISKLGKGYEVRTSIYMSEDEMQKVGAAMNLSLVSYNKSSNIAVSVYESVVNEEYIELPSLMVPAKELLQAYGKWYKDTSMYWSDYADDMLEDSVDEAAKNAQMEILSYLSNSMNDMIKDRKFKVNMDLK